MQRRSILKGALLAGAVALAPWLGAGVVTPQAQAAELTKINFVQEWPVADGFWIPWILGKEKGFYREEGIDLNIIAPPTVADTMKFLGTGRADLAFTTVMDIIFAKEQGAPVTAIGRYGQGNNWGIVSRQGEKFTVAELKGKTIGIYNDAWTKAQLALMLKSANMTLNDIKMVAAADDTVPLLLQKRVDAITGITNAEGTGVVTTGKQKPEFLPAVEHGVPNTPIFMLAGNERWLKNNPEVAKAFMRATEKSIAYAIAHPEEGTTAFTKAYSKAYDPAFIKQQWADTITLLGQPGPDQLKLSDAAWSDLLNAVKQEGIVKETLPAQQYYTNDFLPQGK
ncbi:ABC transporter substrate-binding protein [Nissabacter sp. SGAir0207]|uniref:ABC transporter substrate-binding protein n=1 Tax=Nissabacter sp. SGAir0207 TaxID=2126321 RepID=UPI0010CCE584|nr:ABC transporter substrate-binding protein [Nissabacter sp. SGAir0207]QCR37835.1 ABC transporter substrate-binding protein [Nissabacter sp. SGAir0207]